MLPVIVCAMTISAAPAVLMKQMYQTWTAAASMPNAPWIKFLWPMMNPQAKCESTSQALFSLVFVHAMVGTRKKLH